MSSLEAPVTDTGTNLIALVNQIHDCLAESSEAHGSQHLALQLPQIAVIGSQSAGKSSVLEAFVGRDFLPRGNGICTRRPLVLQLVQMRAEDNEHPPADYAVFSHRHDQIYYEFDQVRNEIIAETQAVAGNDKGISPVPINLKIYSVNVIDLTLVDLPGLTKVPVGDQPSDIETVIREMVISFIERPNCLILAVSPANVDLANSDALQMARSVDPDGDRTIGVLTKLDLMDDGTNSRDVLDNQVIPLQFGYVGVVCRSQKQIENNTRMDVAQEQEMKFFNDHPSYTDIASRCGSRHLRQQLHNLLLVHIATNLPDFKLSIQHQLAELEAKLANCQLQFDYENPNWKVEALTTLVFQWADTFSTQLVGNSDTGLSYDELSEGARIQRLFNTDFKRTLHETEFTETEQLKLEIGYAVMSIMGVHSSLFTPNHAFECVVRKQIRLLKIPIVQLVEDVTSQLLKAVRHASDVMQLQRFPALQTLLEECANSYMHQRSAFAVEAVEQLIAFETAFINTRHEDFIGFNYAEQKASRVRKWRNPGNETVHRGQLKMGDNWYAFVLTPDTLSWYTDQTEEVRLYSVSVTDDLLHFEHQRGIKFRIYSTTRNIVMDKKELELTAPDKVALQKWQMCFNQVGIYAEDATNDVNGNVKRPIIETITSKMLDHNDPVLERQIESVFLLVDSYMQIVCRQLLDIVPKCIVCTLIKDAIKYFRHSLLAQLNRPDRIDLLLEEDVGVVEYRRSLASSIEVCRQTLITLATLKLPNVVRKKKLEKLVVGPKSVPPSQQTRSSSKPLPTRPAPPEKPPRIGMKSEDSQVESSGLRRKSNSVTSLSSNKDLKRMLDKTDTSSQKSTFFV